MGLFEFSVTNRSFVNMVMVAIMALGIYSFFKLPREVNPEISFNWAFIVTRYPGASPEEVERLITIPIEDEIADVERIEAISSNSTEGRSVISVKFENMPKEEFRDLFRDLQAEVDKVRDLPIGVERPEIINFDSYYWQPLVRVIMSGDVPERRMKELAEELKDRIKAVPHVREVIVAGMRDKEVWVEVDPERLRAYRLSLTQVVEGIRRRGMNLPGGTIKGERSEYLLRTVGEFSKAEEIKDVVVSQNRAGLVKVQDLAQVTETLEEPTSITRYNGKRAMALIVIKDGPGNSLTIMREIRGLVKEFLHQAPPNLRVDYVSDSSLIIKEVLDKLISNAYMGGILLFILLYLTMGIRSAIFAAWGLTVAFMGTFLFMRWAGESLNSTSVFGMVLVSGMLVDDAIVIIENVHRYLEMGYDRIRAVLAGAKEVVWPVAISSFTSVVTFLPLLFMPGIIGKFLKIIPAVVIMALLVSLLEALLILPSHIADWGAAVRRGWRAGMFTALRRPYRKALAFSLRNRYLIVALTLIVAVGSASLIPLMGIDLFADEELSFFQIRLSARPGTKIEATSRLTAKVEELAEALPSEELKAVTTNIGMQHTDREIVRNSYVAELFIDLKRERRRAVSEIMEGLRPQAERISGLSTLELVKVKAGPPLGRAVEVKVVGRDLDELRRVVELVKGELRAIPGVYDINDDFQWGKEEVRLLVDEERAALSGLDLATIAKAVRTAFEGEVASQMREGDEEIDVVVKFDALSRGDIRTIDEMYLMGPGRGPVPFKEVARIEMARGPAEIRRFNRNRAITISADVDKEVTTSYEVNRRLIERFRDIGRRFPGYRLDFRGEFQEFKESIRSLYWLLFVGLVLVYILLTAQFKSLFQPLIILLTVPFSFIGAILGLLITGSPFSVVAFYGFVGLAGVVVNDSIVMIDFINQRRSRGQARFSSIMKGAQVRLRPIMLTTVTTMGGLLPMAIGLGGKSAVWMPLANVIIWGLFVSTLLTLIVIPALYAILDDVKTAFRPRMKPFLV